MPGGEVVAKKKTRRSASGVGGKRSKKSRKRGSDVKIMTVSESFTVTSLHRYITSTSHGMRTNMLTIRQQTSFLLNNA